MNTDTDTRTLGQVLRKSYEEAVLLPGETQNTAHKRWAEEAAQAVLAEALRRQHGGWRLLESGEDRKDGDECYVSNVWSSWKTNGPFGQIQGGTDSYLCRRRILLPDQPAEPKAGETSVEHRLRIEAMALNQALAQRDEELARVKELAKKMLI